MVNYIEKYFEETAYTIHLNTGFRNHQPAQVRSQYDHRLPYPANDN